MSVTIIEQRGPHELSGTPYRPIARIGVGTSADVFEAEGPGGARRAVKVLRAVHADAPEIARRLTREARALAVLDHPNLVRVLDAGVTTDGRPYFAMPMLFGETLHRRLARIGAMAATPAAALFLGVLEGLGAAHAAGVVHRDVKPANIFVVPRGKLLGPKGAPRGERCVLIDFGIAKIPDAAGGETTGGHILGTPRYVAPEQILGGRVDARTDVYAAGLVLFEMIAGRGPYDADDIGGLLRAHLRAQPRRLAGLARVSSALDHAVSRALSKEPDRRWPSARAFAEVLSRAVTSDGRKEAAR
jgi:eukaryotic-like serine/threonine-protein kinase